MPGTKRNVPIGSRLHKIFLKPCLVACPPDESFTSKIIINAVSPLRDCISTTLRKALYTGIPDGKIDVEAPKEPISGCVFLRCT